MSRHLGTSASVRSDQRGPERYSAEADGAAPARASSGHPRQRDPVKERDTGSRPQRKEAGTLEKEAEGRSKETCAPPPKAVETHRSLRLSAVHSASIFGAQPSTVS